MRKLLYLLLAAATLSLIGCGGDSTTTEEPGKEVNPTPTPEPEPEP